ncbi:manganese efflux pump [Vibrio genomosp. F6]|uniref:manganese efflux pump MntP n=1 Tax=Vibrio TaxID=662 RepID=UPI0010BDD307|nr:MULTISPECIES: manganese efflux pump MntP family protein [Vibrio]NOH82286.1 manganese efflux pump [Vibrio sp. 03-59-1]TKF21691.1 manganese efflux pump [Vibrio genomosp. F6]
MVDVVILAIALSMDAFAVSIGLGAKHIKNSRALALMSGVYFGAFQGAMPLLGYLGGKGVLGFAESYAPWVAFLLLVVIGGKMIHESMSDGAEKNIRDITHKVMFFLAIATSIDAIAAGFTLSVLDVNPMIACAIIGLITFGFSWGGIFIGSKCGTWLESKMELLGGVTLILIGIKIVCT